MARSIPQSEQDALLDKIIAADEQAFCSQEPTTYFNAVFPELWIAETVFVAGDLVRPPTSNGKIYECTVGGTSGATEPGWGTVQDGTFTDGTVTWKTHNNYALVNTSRVSGDYTKADYNDATNGITGRVVTVAEKVGVIIHTGGIINHCAFICSVDRSVRLVTTAQTTIGGNEVEPGRTTIFYAMKFVVADPIALPIV